MSDAVFAPIVIMVVATTIITPIFLKIVFKDSNDEIVETEVLKGKSQFEEYERETQEALLKNENSDN